jgi:exodeoxyribonuclease V alpha subunit
MNQKQDDFLPGTEPATLEGTVERIVFENADTGFVVARLQQEGNPELVTFVGSMLTVNPGETARISGRWIDDKKFGRQIRVENYESILPSSVDGIEKYLGSGLIQGIGKAYAKRLVDTFGASTLEVIDKQPEKLRRVEGIGQKRAKQIRAAWKEQRGIQEVMVFLQGHGIGTAQAIKIYKKYQERSAAVLREDPYRVAEEITGIGFAGADAIARNMDIPVDSVQRLKAGIAHVLREEVSQGNLFLEREDLLQKSAELLTVERASLESALQQQVEEKGLREEPWGVYLDVLYQAEISCTSHFHRLLKEEKSKLEVDLINAIRWVEQKNSITLSDEQKSALETAIDTPITIITGGPGTGKTTLINSLIAVFQRKGLSVLLAAPTGRAAKRMEEASGQPARTLHRLLEFNGHRGGFMRDEMNPLDTDVLVLDECSMIDISLMEGVLKAMMGSTRLIMVGDVDQLPSVGPGNVLLDLIASGCISTVRLKTIFRQAAESGIISNSHRINRGEEPVYEKSEDFFFIERDDPEKALDTVLELVTQRIPDKFELDPMKDIQVLAPMHRGSVGVSSLNSRLQDALNPSGQPIPRRNFRVGDKVIQVRNNYDLDVFNGDMGIIRGVNVEEQEVRVEYEGRGLVAYDFNDLDNLSLSYAITIHKSQGSEYPALVMPLVWEHYVMLQRNVLYTGITRAKRLVVLVGDPKAMKRALKNTDSTRRNTRLAERLKEWKK